MQVLSRAMHWLHPPARWLCKGQAASRLAAPLAQRRSDQIRVDLRHISGNH